MCDFDSILLHCTKLFIRQSIDREQILDVTFETPPLKNPAYATAVRCGGSILSYCPRNPHGKAGNEERRKEKILSILSLNPSRKARADLQLYFIWNI